MDKINLVIYYLTSQALFDVFFHTIMSELHDKTQFEYLPNEILYQCLGYLNAFELFYSFDELNIRFSSLIRRFRLAIRFDRINKTVFNQFCSKLSLESGIKNQIHLIQLSNSFEYHQCKKFFSYFSLNEFPLLRKFQLLPCSSSSWNQNEIIFSKLQILSIERLDRLSFHHQTSSIINLTLAQCTFNDYFHIIRCLPLLKYFSIEIFHRYHENDSEMKIQTSTAYNLKQLTIDDFRNDFSIIEFLLRQTPILTDLTFCSSYSEHFLDAHRWQSFIYESLSHLKKFQFIFKCFFPDNNQHRMMEIYQQFQSYWLTKYTIHNYHFTIYTVPFYAKCYQFNPNQFTNFTKVKQLTINPALIQDHSQSYFPNLTSLNIYGTYLHDSLLKILNFSKIKFLDISQIYINPSLLIDIFQHSIHLISLTINNENLSKYYHHADLCTYFNQMIKQLYVTSSDSYQYNFLQDKQFYETFSHVEHVNCSITNQDDLFMLTKSLSKLVTCELVWNGTDNFQLEFDQFEKYAREHEIDFHSKIDTNYQNQYFDKPIFSYNIFLWL